MLAGKLTRLALLAIIAAAPALAQTSVITNAKAWTGTARGTIDDATIIIVDGEIAEVRTQDFALPTSAEIIDAEGRWVTPGIIATFSRLGIVEVSAEAASDDRSASGSDYSVALRAVDGFNPRATNIPVTRLEGVTRAVVAPQTGSSMFAGRGFIADTTGDSDSVAEADAFVFVRMGEAGAGLSGGSRAAEWAHLRAALADARSYPTRYITQPMGEALSRTDAQALDPASRGEQLILIEAHRASDITALIAFAAENPRLNLAILGASEGWMVADALSESKIPVIIDPHANLPAGFDQLGATMANPQRLMDAGVVTAFAYLGRNANQPRLVLQAAGNAVANGVSHNDALSAITVAPALIFGMDGHGVLEAGAAADLVIWDGDPLEIMSAPDMVMIAGDSQPMESRQTQLRDRYLGLNNGDFPFAYKQD